MGIFGRFSRDRPRPEPRSPTGQGDPHNRRRSMGFNPTGPSSELQPAPGPHPHHRAPSAPSAAPPDDGTAELPLEDHQQAPEPYAGFSEPGTPPTSRKGSTALLNSQGSMYRQQNSVPPANGTSGMSSSLSPGVLTTPKQDGTPYDVPYGHTRVFIGAGFDQVLERVVLCLQLQGFHIMASVDLQDALQGAKVQCGDFRRYTMLTACHPKLFFKGVFEEPSLGLLPPSTVLVMEGDFNKNDIVVQVTKPSTIYRALHNASPKLRGILSETDARFKLVLDSIASMAEDSYA